MKKHLLRATLALFGFLAVGSASAQISTATLVINPTPVATAPTNVTACNGGTVAAITLAGTPTGVTFDVTNSNTTIGVSNATGVTAIPSFTAANSTTATIVNTVTVTPKANGCTGTPVTFTITVYPTPVATVPSNVVACKGATVPTINLTGTPTTGLTFDVTHSAPGIGVSNATNVTSIPSFTAVNTTNAPIVNTVTVTPKANGCTGTAITFTITVNPGAAVNPISNALACNGTSVGAFNFTSPATGGTVTYNWTNSDATIGLGASGTGAIPAFNVANTGTTNKVATITVTPSYANGGSTCTGTATTFTITAYPTPNGTLAVNTPICEGQAVDLTFTSTVSGAPGPYSLNISQYKQGITPPATPTTYTNIISGTSFGVAAPVPTGSGTFKFDLVKITDANGCVKQ